jgi:hypothetical protein
MDADNVIPGIDAHQCVAERLESRGFTPAPSSCTWPGIKCVPVVPRTRKRSLLALERILVMMATLFGGFAAGDALAYDCDSSVPAEVLLELQSDLIPISRDDPGYTEFNLDIYPAIYLKVAFADGEESDWFNYNKDCAEVIIFDDITDDPDDLIEVVYWDVGKGQTGTFAAQLTSTGNGTGTATLSVSFLNSDEVGYVEVTVCEGDECQN